MGLIRTRLEAPPRTVEPMLAAQMLLGSAATQIGWFLFAFGSIFFWVFAWHADLSGWRFRQGSIATVTGSAESCRDTHYSVGKNHSRGTPVYENRYRYSVNGVSYESNSYDTGTCMASRRVIVEYLLDQPAYSRIRGMRHGLLSP